MKITRVEAIPFRIPMLRTEHFATGAITSLDHVLVRVHTDDGLVGHAEAPPRSMIYGESIASVLHAVREWFAPGLVGLHPADIEKAFAILDTVEQNPAAKAAVDIALHDIVGQMAGLPLYRVFGGWSNEVELTYILGLGTPDEVADQALKVIAEYGIRTLKLKAGLDPQRDTAMLQRVRTAVGPAVRLYLDANHAFPSLVAARAMKRWEEFDVAWVEEPCPVWDRAGRALIARSTTIPMMADESCKTVAAVTAEIAYGYSRLISIKTGGTGFTLSNRIRVLCEAHGLVPVSGSQSDSDLGAIAGAHFNAGHRSLAQGPAELTSFLDTGGRLLTEPITIRDGKFSLGERPGLGVTIDEKQLTKYRLDG
jgi:L-alanine-DL-glutamate epimerase-like enolase superfamily enzyme